MLKLIRKKGIIKALIWIVAVLIIISFGFLGTAYLVTDYNQKKYAGEIFGEKIPVETFQKHLETVNINSLIQYGDKYYDVRQYLNLPGQAWDRLILLHEAVKQNINVTDQEVIEQVQKYPFFRKGDNFDDALYQQITANVFKTTPRAFEENTRDSLRIAKMIDNLGKDIQVGDEELFEVFKKSQEKVQVSYITLTPDDFKSVVSVNDEEIEAFYNEKKLDFIQPESVNVEYLSMDFPENATEDDKALVRQKADELLTDILSGDAANVLENKKLSLKTTGFFSRENPKTDLGWPLESLNTVFDLTAGEWFGPFENNQSVLLARVQERRDAYMPELVEINSKVKDAIIKEKGLELAKGKMAEHLEIIRGKLSATNAPDFNSWSEGLNLNAVQTPMFSRGQYLPKIGISPEFQEAAFKLSENNLLSDVVNTNQGSFLLFFNGYTPAGREEFEKVKDRIEKEFISMKKNEMYSMLTSKLRAQSNLKNYLEQDR